MRWFAKIKLRKGNSSRKSLLKKLRKAKNSLIQCQADLESKIQQEILYIKKVESYNKTEAILSFNRKKLMEIQLENINKTMTELECKIEIHEKYLIAFECSKKNGVKINIYLGVDDVKKNMKDSAINRRLEQESTQDDDDDEGDDDELEQELAELMGFSKSSGPIVESCQINKYKKERAPQPIVP